jgi:hypothetical protein
VAQDAKNAVSTATGAAKEQLVAATTTTKTVTQPAKTVTEPARTQTVTRTETTTLPGNTTTISSHTTSVKVNPTTTSDKESSGSIPAWGWVLIGVGAVLLVVAIFMIGRSRGARARDAAAASGPSRPPDAGVPPRGPPNDPI